MEPLRIYDYLTRSRQRVFDWVRPLGAEDYAREPSAGQRSIGQTLTHIMICEWYYVQRIEGREVPPYDEWPIQDEKPPAFAVLEAAWNEQAARTLETVRAIRDWGTKLEYQVDDDGRPTIIGATVSDIFTQLVLHEVHHRGQVMSMLRRLGVNVEDIDFNALMYERRAATPA
jgi:uncharacterized damage-inducible protein DinB